MIELEPNQTKTVTFTLTENELRFYDNLGEFVVENGDFKVFVGGDSLAKLSSEFKI